MEIEGSLASYRCVVIRMQATEKGEIFRMNGASYTFRL